LVVPDPELIEVPVEIPVEVDPGLLKKGELAVPDLGELERMTTKDQLIHITSLMHWNTTRAMQCYGQLDEIGAGHAPQGTGNDSNE
jgi:hypothetical protein